MTENENHLSTPIYVVAMSVTSQNRVNQGLRQKHSSMYVPFQAFVLCPSMSAVLRKSHQEPSAAGLPPAVGPIEPPAQLPRPLLGAGLT